MLTTEEKTTQRQRCTRQNVALQDEETADYEYRREVYKLRAQQLMKKGLGGMVIGATLGFVLGMEDGLSFAVPMSFAAGFLLAGASYGWELLGRIFGHWYTIGSMPVVIILLAVQFAVSVMIGWLVFPIALLYNAMNAQQKGSTARVILIVLFAVCLVFAILFFIIACGGFSAKEASPDEMRTVMSIVPLEDIPADLIEELSELAQALTEKHAESRRKDHYEITSDPAIMNIYYLESEDPAVPYSSSRKNYTMYSGLAVETHFATHYNRTSLNFAENIRHLVVIPDLSGIYSGESDFVYKEYILDKDTEEEFLEWMSGEFSGVKITKIS